MLQKLMTLPAAIVEKLRHLRIRGETSLLSFGDEDVFYRLDQIFKLLPGLQLDTLTVLGVYADHANYDTLSTLIEYGNGWKRLRYICHSSSLLEYAQPVRPFDHELNVRYQRKPQPAHWINVMNRRNGSKRKSSVMGYRSTQPGKACSVLHRESRVPFQQSPPQRTETTAFAKNE